MRLRYWVGLTLIGCQKPIQDSLSVSFLKRMKKENKMKKLVDQDNDPLPSTVKARRG